MGSRMMGRQARASIAIMRLWEPHDPGARACSTPSRTTSPTKHTHRTPESCHPTGPIATPDNPLRPPILRAGDGATKATPVEVTTDKAPVYPAVREELLPAAWHRTEQYANNLVEADHGRLKARLRPMRGLKQDHSARVIIAGYAFIQNLRRGHYELAVEEPTTGDWRSRSTSWSWRSDPKRTRRPHSALQPAQSNSTLRSKNSNQTLPNTQTQHHFRDGPLAPEFGGARPQPMPRESPHPSARSPSAHTLERAISHLA